MTHCKKISERALPAAASAASASGSAAETSAEAATAQTSAATGRCTDSRADNRRGKRAVILARDAVTPGIAVPAVFAFIHTFAGTVLADCWRNKYIVFRQSVGHCMTVGAFGVFLLA